MLFLGPIALWVAQWSDLHIYVNFFAAKITVIYVIRILGPNT